MIWRVTTIDEAFMACFTEAGEPDQATIDAYLRQTKQPQHTKKNPGVKRWYYLQQENPRISFTTVGRPLSDWTGLPAKLIVVTRTIIGEFPANRPYQGLLGFQLKCEPIEWLRNQADREFAMASDILPEISEQVLDRHRIEASQEQIKQRYQW
jgi:hypothetical protein